MRSRKNSAEDLIINPAAGDYMGIIRLQMVQEDAFPYGDQRVSDAAAAAKMAYPLFARADREMMAVLSVNSSMQPLAFEIVAVGGINTCYVDMKNMFKHAILNNAGNIICFHNHPGGSHLPSKEDRKITEKIQKAGELLDIRLVDHIILCDDCYYSFCRKGAFHYEGWGTEEEGGDISYV